MLEALTKWQKALSKALAFKTKPVVIAVLSALLLTTVYNISFWRQFLKIPEISVTANAGLLVGSGIIVTCVFFTIFTIFSYRYVFKGVLILTFVLAATISYFSLKYGVVIDRNMISNILETDMREASELFSVSFVCHLLLFAVLPTFIITRLRLTWRKPLRQLLSNVIYIVGTLLLIGAIVYLNYRSYSLIGREHKYMRMYLNPTYAVYATEKYFRKKYSTPKTLLPIAQDAVLERSAENRRRRMLGVVVVGESARAGEFSLNGYERETNPCLSRKQVVSFTQAYSSGTSTAESVPCMFSHLSRKKCSKGKAGHYENILDILQRLGVDVLWRDNNSSSKGVAKRIHYERLSAAIVPDAERLGLARGGEYFDESLLYGLQQYIDSSTHDDILIVLHQKGSHGPAYYKRYPEQFRKFTPVYRYNTPQNSTRDTLVNAYDNTILYTDYFLAKTIDLLEINAAEYNSFLLYMSDHGESLGENGIYLHGLPYFMAPDEQKHIAAVVWLSESTRHDLDIDMTTLRDMRDQPIAHSFIFHSLLGIFGVKTKVYNQDLDIFRTGYDLVETNGSVDAAAGQRK